MLPARLDLKQDHKRKFHLGGVIGWFLWQILTRSIRVFSYTSTNSLKYANFSFSVAFCVSEFPFCCNVLFLMYRPAKSLNVKRPGKELHVWKCLSCKWFIYTGASVWNQSKCCSWILMETQQICYLPSGTPPCGLKEHGQRCHEGCIGHLLPYMNIKSPFFMCCFENWWSQVTVRQQFESLFSSNGPFLPLSQRQKHRGPRQRRDTQTNRNYSFLAVCTRA